MASQLLRWSGPKGGHIGVGFDDEHFNLAQMRAEIAFVREAHPTLPDEVPLGTSFVFAKESTGHLFARFRVGDKDYEVSRKRGLRCRSHRPFSCPYSPEFVEGVFSEVRIALI